MQWMTFKTINASLLYGSAFIKGADNMKTYQVELKRVSYVNLTVEADSLEAAEDAAWLELQTGDFDDRYADWTLESIDEEVAA
jgi:hypothetical protein